MAQTMRAIRPGYGSRRPKTRDGRRICRNASCTTKLSRYNNREFCHQHSPRRFPRVRGQFTESYSANRADTAP